LKKLFYSAALLSLILLLGCAGGKVKVLQDQMAVEQARKAALQTQVDFLQASLNAARTTQDSVKGELERKDEVIRQFALILDSLRSGLETPLYQGGQGGSAEVEAREPAPELPQLEKSTLSGSYKTNYDHALELFHKKKFTDAAALFRSLLESDRANKLAGNCQFWLGECFYAQTQFEAALTEFEKVFAFPNSYKADAAQYKIALCYLTLKKYPEAREELNRLISAHPASEYVARARIQLDQIP
jgi:TolA-binding protein